MTNVQENIYDDSASDSVDEKKIRAADSHAVNKLESVKSEEKKHNVRKRQAECFRLNLEQFIMQPQFLSA